MKVFKKLSSLILFLSCIFCFFNFVGAFGTDESQYLKIHPKLSIVVPVYNVAPYLDEALDSVENQTYKDMEIICVNDGSTDGSLQILQDHAKKDSRIKIISQENQGLSEARNVGIRASIGEYIYFFDSDDILAPYAMEKSIGFLEKYDADASEFKWKKFYYTEDINTSKLLYEETPVKVKECLKNQNPFKVFGVWPVSACVRVYKKSFLTDNNLNFKKDIRTNEDVLFNYLTKACMKKLVQDSNVEYFYRSKRPGSIMNTDWKVLTKRISGYLITIRELVLNKGRFKFPNSNEYLLATMLDFVYSDIKNLKDISDKRLLASKAYKEIYTDFAVRYKVKLSKKDKKKLEDLKRWSRDIKPYKKVDKKTKNIKVKINK